MRFKKQFNGYDYQEVEAFLLETNESEREDLIKDMAQAQACNQHNLELIRKNDDLLKQLIRHKQKDRQIADQVLAQVKLIEETYLNGRAILAQAGTEAQTQLHMLEENYQILREINEIISHIGINPINNDQTAEVEEE
ncbi:MAG TPA: hypothetical protein VFC73_09240 [Syntrophomonadaceae bacterium]|nr:hypothetical protein [Syntrophomonadaceae bacterium]